MKLTNHSVQRMKQRNINQEMIMLANIFGEPSNKGEKIILKRKDIHRIMKVLEVLERRGGITIVDDQDTLITTYFNDSFNRKLKSNSDFNFI
ncbi:MULTISPECIES: DUF4258 domain-containing protein [Acinetobacter]|jgi:hypothetical protein|uniref:DUF4258 domain-containing protein n=1 Tax=Acinetobacter wuhouensis TaxID=1879050 RepID=A0A4Q7ACF3_9GAMM|nr:MULTISPECIES: DUF4258 domain-containing protein [Acinetobacter]QIC75025.1 DUF4258 domain-containing protein [Acinetobacter indicus]RZG42949.1 DUF4258 domain-containing protein [Acinetobacter wuhouensis]RZG71774.1 DUF4258 domain-containing protein [Acinetobacter sp. WCHAc060025]WPC33504.1 hypothetical protein O4J62_14125 [Acinetobacter towneri]